MALIRSVRGFTPEVDSTALLAENCAVIGDVKIAAKASIWYNVTIRGDVMPIRIGSEANVQDGAVIHGTYQKYGTTIERRATIGHMVMMHGCHIGEASLIGMGSILMDGVRIGKHSIVGAGSLVTEGKEFPERSLIMGRPAKWVRALTDEEVQRLEDSADNYLHYTKWYGDLVGSGSGDAGHEKGSL